MSTIVKKIKKGNPYYYAVESKRVNGQPRIVWQKYLGTLDNIINKCSSASSTDDSVREVDIFEAGGVAAMLRIAQKLNFVEIIDEHIPKRDQGASIGQYLLIAAINRVLAPCSKLQISEWYQKSILYRLWKLPPDLFSSQSFWNNMDMIPEEILDVLQEKIALNLKNEYGIDPTLMLYDTTNFYTYVATGNKRNTVSMRGRNKAKRDDLRQVGLALLVSNDFQIPLFHKTYQGNIPDRGLFPEISTEIVEWRKKIFKGNHETTLIFDKGNISDEAMFKLIVPNQKFVCAVPKTTDSELFSVDIGELNPIFGLPGTKANSYLVEIWSKKLKAVLAYSESYFASELVELTESIRKCEKQLHDLEKWLEKGPGKPSDIKYYSLASVNAKIKDILSKPYVKDIINISVKVVNKIPRISYFVDQQQLDQVMRTDLGRTLLFTSRLEWDEKKIISAYRSQQNIENVFKHMKNREYLHWQPSFHWTDQKIKVHSFYSVMALLFASLAHKTVVENGVDITLLNMLDELSDIREVALIYTEKTKSKKKDQIVLSRMSPKQKRLAEILEIQKVLKG